MEIYCNINNRSFEVRKMNIEEKVKHLNLFFAKAYKWFPVPEQLNLF